MPPTAAKAHAALGSTAEFYTASTLRCHRTGVKLSHVDTTAVKLRPLAVAEIDRYVEREKPFDCAGGFKAEALGIMLFERIDTEDPTADRRSAADLAGRRLRAVIRALTSTDAPASGALTILFSAAQGVDHCREIRRQRRTRMNSTPVSGQMKLTGAHAGTSALSPTPFMVSLKSRIAVFLVAGERITRMGGMHANLMRTAVSSSTSTRDAFLPKNCTGLKTLTASLPGSCAFTCVRRRRECPCATVHRYVSCRAPLALHEREIRFSTFPHA